MGNADLSRPTLSSRMTGTHFPRPKKKAKAAASSVRAPTLEIIHLLQTEAAPSTIVEGVREMPLPPSLFCSTTSLLDLVKKFGQIKTKLQSHSPSSESHLLQNARRIFKDWIKRDFNASFSLKILHDVEKVLIKLYKAQLLTNAQYESFLNFFENMRALREQHQKADRASNRVKCF